MIDKNRDLNEQLLEKIINSNRFRCVVNLKKTATHLLQTYQPKSYTQLVNLMMSNKNYKWY